VKSSLGQVIPGPCAPARVLGVSPTTALAALRAEAAAAPEPEVAGPVADLKLDEFWSSVCTKRLKRLQRRTSRFSKKIDLRDAVIKLYVYDSNLRRHQF
jgi:hypothetical protein